MATNEVKYIEEASKVLNVPAMYLERFIDFIIKLDDEKLRILLNSSQTGITENISKFLYNLHYHKMIKINNDEGGLSRFSEDEIARLGRYINNVAEKINHLKQEKIIQEVPAKETELEEELVAEEKATEEYEVSPEIANWIEKGKKVVLEDKKDEWEVYIKKSMSDISPLKPDFAFILDLMEKIKTLDNSEDIGALVKKSNYSLYMYNNLKNVMKEFLGIDIDEYQLEEEPVKLKPAKVEEEPSSVLDGIDTTNITDSQRANIDKIKELEIKQQEKEKELEVAENELEILKGQYRIKNNAYRTATYGIKARHESQIMTEQNRINGIFAEARIKEKEAKRSRNKQLIKDIFSKADTEKGEKKGFFGNVASNWEKTKNDYEESIQNIRTERDEAVSTPEEEIKKNNEEIEKARNELKSIARRIKEQEEKVKDISYEIYEIKLKIVTLQRLLEKSAQLGLLERPIRKEDIDLDR